MSGTDAKKSIKEYVCSCGNKNTLNGLITDKIWVCKSCRCKGAKNPMCGKNVYDIWVYKYGKEEADVRWEKRIEKVSGEKNHFFGKKHTDVQKLKWSNEMKSKYAGENNPMYGKSVYDTWVKRYGVEEADERMKIKSLKHSEHMAGENNPMYRISLYDFWREKYGEEKAKDLIDKHKRNISNVIAELKKTDRWDDIIEKISNALKGREFSDDHRKNLRIGMIKHIQKFFPAGKPFQPNFNPDACKVFDEIAKEQNINIQHALNGGEFYVKELGYFVDGYDKINNVVYEYDESFHYKNGKLRDRDERRQSEIEKLLGCKFIRIKA